MILDVSLLANVHTYYATFTFYEQRREQLLSEDPEVRKRNRSVFLSKWQIDLLGGRNFSHNENGSTVRTPTLSRSIRLPVPVRTACASAPTFCSSLAAQRYTLDVPSEHQGFEPPRTHTQSSSTDQVIQRLCTITTRIHADMRFSRVT
jgi:hypothetical protein